MEQGGPAARREQQGARCYTHAHGHSPYAAASPLRLQVIPRHDCFLQGISADSLIWARLESTSLTRACKELDAP